MGICWENMAGGTKRSCRYYEEIARTPLFVWDPRCGVRGERRRALTQTIDLPATILEYFGLALPADMQGRPLRPVIERDEPIRGYALFGYHESHINLTDGRWVYMKAPVSPRREDFVEYTLMPTHMRSMFTPAELQKASLHPPFSFTKGCPVLEIPAQPGMTSAANFGTRLYDLKQNPGQQTPLEDWEQEARLAQAMYRLLQENDCPDAVYRRFGLEEEITPEQVCQLRQQEQTVRIPEVLAARKWTAAGRNVYDALARFLPGKLCSAVEAIHPDTVLNETVLLGLIDTLFPEEQQDMVRYFAVLNSRCE